MIDDSALLVPNKAMGYSAFKAKVITSTGMVAKRFTTPIGCRNRVRGV